MTRRLVVLAITVGSLVGASCGGSGGGNVTSDRFVQEGDQAPEFSLPDAQGPPVSLGDYRGKKDVLLYFSMGPG
jgi:hypothetical protein